jgi:F-type H+-transporting ATPase subunit gamma
MSQRQELDARLALYGDLRGILNAMRSFALAELRRVVQREAAQQQTAAALAPSLSAMAPVLPVPEKPRGDVWVVLGSVRGFCASFNEDVLRLWQQEWARDRILSTIVLGERLGTLMPELAHAAVVPGAISAVDAVNAIDRILVAFDAARTKAGGNAGLIICFRDDGGARTQRLLPIAVKPSKATAEVPMTNEAPAHIAAVVGQHYLFHLLLALLLRSLRVENHMRLMQMENALQHIERNTGNLSRLRNQLRQEEIVEEIELILRTASPFE